MRVKEIGEDDNYGDREYGPLYLAAPDDARLI
jgi:hypothetical protein